MSSPKGPITPSPKLVQLQKDFLQIASMSGFVNSSFDPPQLRLLFTLYARLNVENAEEGHAITPKLQAWCERVGQQMREDSSSAILPPQVQMANPQALPDGSAWNLVATMNFSTKVTENSYLRIRTAVMNAYQAALALREGGVASLMADKDL